MMNFIRLVAGVALVAYLVYRGFIPAAVVMGFVWGSYILSDLFKRKKPAEQEAAEKG